MWQLTFGALAITASVIVFVSFDTEPNPYIQAFGVSSCLTCFFTSFYTMRTCPVPSPVQSRLKPIVVFVHWALIAAASVATVVAGLFTIFTFYTFTPVHWTPLRIWYVLVFWIILPTCVLLAGIAWLYRARKSIHDFCCDPYQPLGKEELSEPI